MSIEYPVTLCGQRLDGLMHTCAFVDSRDQQYEILLPFLREGVAAGNAALLTVVDPANHADHLARLRGGDIDCDGLWKRGQLLDYTFQETYLQDNGFSADRMLKRIEDAIDAAHAAGFHALRGFGEMHWALTGLPGTEELIEYEMRVNFLAPKLRNPLVCVYDVNKFSGRVLMDILSTHPKVILGGQIHDNPYYLPPAEFLSHRARLGRLSASSDNAPS